MEKMGCDITKEDLEILLEKFAKNAYVAGSCEEGSFEYETTTKIENLLNLDYKTMELDNTNGILNPQYPCKIFIPEYERERHNNFNFFQNNDKPTSSNYVPDIAQEVIYEELSDATKIREIINMAKYARCRQRFVVPVILIKGNYICRSSTISVIQEIYGRRLLNIYFEYWNRGGDKNNETEPKELDENNSTTHDNSNDIVYRPELSPFSYDAVIQSDIELLKFLNVKTIIDLMVEHSKVKYFLTVSSSEKANANKQYSNFNILSLPYPGCEFFSEVRTNNYMAENVVFDWTQSFINATLTIPKSGPAFDLVVNWQEYQKWDLAVLTKNYLKAALTSIQEEKSGILVHCISGWDRTPLFISLLRLSLWADGLIHESMTALQMTYFTLAYDWYQFGHQLPSRLKHKEHVMYFCFHYLKYITDEELSIVKRRKRPQHASISESVKEDHDSNDSFASCYDAVSTSNDADSFANNLTNHSSDTSTKENDSSCNNLNNRSPNPTGNENIIKDPSPNPKRSKTSPVLVPEGRVGRQRNESISSLGSFRHVSKTGSIESVVSIKDSEKFISLRKQRLDDVRTFFIQAYSKKIDF